jgi:hypothetical protein
MKPRIFYLDENRKYQRYGLEPYSMAVKELRIKDWTKEKQ